jgi:peroxiredoxin
MPGPQVDDAAPDFTLPRSLEAVLTLSECLVHGPVLLHFYSRSREVRGGMGYQ